MQLNDCHCKKDCEDNNDDYADAFVDVDADGDGIDDAVSHHATHYAVQHFKLVVCLWCLTLCPLLHPVYVSLLSCRTVFLIIISRAVYVSGVCKTGESMISSLAAYKDLK